MVYEPTWNSLRTHVTPQWLRDAKFGIYTQFTPPTGSPVSMPSLSRSPEGRPSPRPSELELAPQGVSA